MIVQSYVSRDAFAITPNDGASLAKKAYGIYVGTTGNIRVLTEGGTDITFNSVPAGYILPFVVTKVFATSTTASNLVGCRTQIAGTQL